MENKYLLDEKVLSFFDKILDSNDSDDIQILMNELGMSEFELGLFISNNFNDSFKPEVLMLLNELNFKQTKTTSSNKSEGKHQYSGSTKKAEKSHRKSGSVSKYRDHFSGGMNKEALIDAMSEHAGITKAAAKKALETALSEIEGALQKGNRVSLVGFGSWSVSRRAAREGTNPMTGEAIKIKAKNVIKFKAGSDLSNAIN